MRSALAGLSLLAATSCVSTPVHAHERFHYGYGPPVRFVVPPPRYYYPPPVYYHRVPRHYAPAPVFVYPHHKGFYRPHRFHRHFRPYHRTPRGSVTFFFKF